MVASETGVAAYLFASSLAQVTDVHEVLQHLVAALARGLGVRNGSYCVGARSSPTSIAASGSVSSDVVWLKYVSAAVSMP